MNINDEDEDYAATDDNDDNSQCSGPHIPGQIKACVQSRIKIGEMGAVEFVWISAVGRRCSPMLLLSCDPTIFFSVVFYLPSI